VKRRHTRLLAPSLALAVALSGATGAAIGYLHFERIAGNERLAAERAERANAELQDALSRMRDQLAAAQLRIDALSGQLAAAQEEQMRAADEIQQQLAAYHGAPARRTIAARGKSAPAPKAQGSPVVLAGNPPAASQQPAPATGSLPMAVASSPVKNFTAPGSTPSYFSGESTPFLGTGKQ